jgi:hypothetical protein
VKRPLVLTASQKVIDQARLLGFHGCLENAIELAIIAGRLRGAKVGQEAPVFLGDDFVCICSKQRTQSGRKGWKPITVRRVERRRAA